MDALKAQNPAYAITVDGQSLPQTGSFLGGTSFPGRQQTALKVPIYVEAISGYSWQQLLNDLVPRCSQHARSAKRTVYEMCGGTTQLWLGASGASIYASMVACSVAAKAAGFTKVLGATITPSVDFVDGLITISATGGTWTVTYRSQTTSALAFNISAAALQTALRGLSSIGGTNITVTGSDGGPYTLTFATGAIFYSGALTTNPASLTGGSQTAVYSTKLFDANTLIRADASLAFDRVVDPIADSRLADPFDTTYYVDGTHPTTGSGGGAVALSEVYDAGVVAMMAA